MAEPKNLTYQWLVGILVTVVFALTALLWNNLSNQVAVNTSSISANITTITALTENVKVLTEQVKDLKEDVKEVKGDVKALRIK